MKLKLDALGMIPADYPKTFYRVSTWSTDSYVADYSSEDEAKKASFASTHGGRFDHKVSTMHLAGA
ncbi:hypothetical protein [Pelagibacterium lentulum]|uniref:Uncharacterized protein n=1 Tax=Pelagibacterium lentulum TaxID=2029865 RepID=A0A916W487_9HYPH|nr:hypothetical protein [Pelagibacterium lentulum]GGA64629.1 hypothetical protein GCM10011499_38870 [Pelagibacterium lentulum]